MSRYGRLGHCNRNAHCDGQCWLFAVQQESSDVRVKALSEDHKPHVPSEQERIEGAGRVVVQHTVPSSNQADGTTDIISKVQLSL